MGWTGRRPLIAVMQIAKDYTELNDPDVQESKFREQLKGLDAEKNVEENTFRTMDLDFLCCVKVGMRHGAGHRSPNNAADQSEDDSGCSSFPIDQAGSVM